MPILQSAKLPNSMREFLSVLILSILGLSLAYGAWSASIVLVPNIPILESAYQGEFARTGWGIMLLFLLPAVVVALFGLWLYRLALGVALRVVRSIVIVHTLFIAWRFGSSWPFPESIPYTEIYLSQAGFVAIPLLAIAFARRPERAA